MPAECDSVYPVAHTGFMRTFPALAIAAALAPAALWAHHSFAAEFDSSRPVTLHGIVTKVSWSNPHVFLWMDVAGPDGKATNWMIESASPNGLQERGFTRLSLKPGDAVTIYGFIHKDQPNFAKTDTITLPGGKKIVTGHAGEGGSAK
jgi:hypothetical protein